MRFRPISIVVAFALTFVFSFSADARWRRKREVNSQVKVELETLFDTAAKLHKALFLRDEVSTEDTIREMASLVRKTQNLLLSDGEGSLIHLSQVLGVIGGRLNLTQEFEGDRRRETLRDVFGHFVQIATNYKVKSHRLFFCPKDRAVWVQKGWKAKNPFNPDTLGSCGAAIR